MLARSAIKRTGPSLARTVLLALVSEIVSEVPTNRFPPFRRFVVLRESRNRIGKMGKFSKVLVLEVECAKDKNPNTPGGKYRRDTPWLVEAFKKKGVESDVLFITNKDNADNLASRFPNTAFLGRVNPMDYPGVLTLNEYVEMLTGLNKKGLLLGPIPEHMDRLGSKMILYELRDSTMGVDGVKLHLYENMKKNTGEIDEIIPKGGPPRVLKMMRGSTGLGVWKLENKSDDVILLTDAYTQKTEEVPRKEASIIAICLSLQYAANL